MATGSGSAGATVVDFPGAARVEVRNRYHPISMCTQRTPCSATVSVAVGLALVTLVPLSRAQEIQTRWGFSVEAKPGTATIALLDGPEAYRPGMLLVPGYYEVEVSAPGFVTRREWVKHSESETLLRVELHPLTAFSPSLEPVAERKLRACDGGDAESCLTSVELIQLRGLFIPGVSRARAADRLLELCARAKEVQAGACDDGDAGSCFSLAKRANRVLPCLNWAEMEEFSARGIELYERACDGGDAGSCFGLAYGFENGFGVSQDRSIAVGLYQKACGGGYHAACSELERIDGK